MLTQFQHEVTCEFFKSAVGAETFCKGCQGILDCSRAVEFTLYDSSDPKPGEPVNRDRAVYHLIVCGPCADRALPTVERVRGNNTLRAEVFDGRAVDWGCSRLVRQGMDPYKLEGLTITEPADPNQLNLSF